jgi:hypothetical protein
MTTVLITGGSSGIGLALATRYAADGYNLVLVGRSEPRLAEVAHELRHVRVDTIVADLATPEGARVVAAAVEQRGLSVDILVNNAGAGLHGAFAGTPLERELELVQLNVASVIQLTKALLPGMLSRGRGHVVNIASVAAFLPGPFQSVYYATKAFVLSFSEALAEELRSSAVGVTAVCPGPTTTGFHAAALVRRARPFRPGYFLTARAVAEATVRGVRRNRRVVVPGLKHRLLVLAIQLAPRRLVAWASGVAGRPAEG